MLWKLLATVMVPKYELVQIIIIPATIRIITATYRLLEHVKYGNKCKWNSQVVLNINEAFIHYLYDNIIKVRHSEINLAFKLLAFERAALNSGN